jgi:drug/metabolite transporter (DMT)-like permease
MPLTQGTRKRRLKTGFFRAAPVVFLLLWSSGFVFLKIGLVYVDPLTFLALRYGLVLVLLAPAALYLRTPFPATRAAFVHVAMVGVFVQAAYFALTYVAIKLGLSAGAVALVTSLQPILVALAAPALTGERVGAMRWSGLILGVLGAALVIIVKTRIEATSGLAILAALGALAGITLGTLYEKRFGTAQHVVTANLIQCGVAFAVTLPLAFALEEMRIQWTAELLLSLVYLVVANSLIAITLLRAMIRHGEASRVSALFFLVPPTTAAVAWLLIDEPMPVPAWLGLALAAAGIALVARSRKTVAAPAEPVLTAIAEEQRPRN